MILPHALPSGVSIPCGLKVVVSAPVSSTAIATFTVPNLTTATNNVVVPVLRTTSQAVTPILACLMPTPIRSRDFAAYSDEDDSISRNNRKKLKNHKKRKNHRRQPQDDLDYQDQRVMNDSDNSYPDNNDNYRNDRRDDNYNQDYNRRDGNYNQDYNRKQYGNDSGNQSNAYPDGNGLEYNYNQSHQGPQPNGQYNNNNQMFYTTSVVCPLATATVKKLPACSKSASVLHKKGGKKGKIGSGLSLDIGDQIMVTSVVPASTVTATEIIAFANIRTRTLVKHYTTPVTVTATQINAYELLKTRVTKVSVTETDTQTNTVTSMVTKTTPESVLYTSYISVVVPTVQVMTNDVYHTVTIKEPVFQTITATPTPETHVSLSVMIQTATVVETRTANPVEVFVSTTVVQF
jgi:hypothetical protein